MVSISDKGDSPKVSSSYQAAGKDIGEMYHEPGPSSRAYSPVTTSDFSLGSSHSVMDMPVEGTKLAPRLFRGDSSEVEPFLRRF